MITSLFKKSTPLNYGLIIVAIFVFFFVYQIGHANSASGTLIAQIGMLLIIYASLFIANFIIKRNGLGKDSAYTALALLLFFLFFPAVMNRPNLLLSNFFILLALRRLISMQSMKATKEKIFDASLWIFVAALFHFWSILFIILVFLSILFHVSRDYRNWVLPFIALLATGLLVLLYASVFDESLIGWIHSQTATSLKINYFTDSSQNLALSVFSSVSLFFAASMLLTLTGRPLVLQSSFKKIFACFIIGVAIWVISPNKSNEMLIFTFAPLAFMATAHIELPTGQIKKEVTLALFIACGLFLFFLQL